MRKSAIFKKCSISVCLAATLAAVPLAHAQLLVLDPANLLENIMSAIESVTQTTTQISQLESQYQQYATMVTNLRSLDASRIASELGFAPTADQIANLRQTLTAVQDMSQGLNQVKSSFNSRLDESRLMNMSWSDYVTWERGRLQRQNSAAVTRVAAEQRAMDQISKDSDFVQSEMSKIGENAGVQQSLGQLNLQVSHMIQQNSEMLRQMALANGSQAAEKQMQEAESKTLQTTKANNATNQNTAARADGLAVLRGWLRSN